MGVIALAGYLRVSRLTQYADRLRRYDLLVDGVREERIGAGSSVEIEVPPGGHELRAKIDWGSSNALAVEIEEGGRCDLEVGSRVGGWRVLLGILYATVLRSRYLYLRQTPPNASRS